MKQLNSSCKLTIYFVLLFDILLLIILISMRYYFILKDTDCLQKHMNEQMCNRESHKNKKVESQNRSINVKTIKQRINISGKRVIYVS